MRNPAPWWYGIAMALASATLFGASTPFAKGLLGQGADPGLLAGLLYLGSGLGLSVIWGFLKLSGGLSEAPLRRSDVGWMALVTLFGGVLGPLLLMLGLSSTPASSAALLLNVEGLATMGIAWVVFRENVDRQLMMGALAILAGAVVLSWSGGPEPVGWGAGLIVGACLCWGIDNNLTRRLSGSDPVQIAAIKGLAAGGANLAFAIWNGATIPAMPTVFLAGALGLVGYGLSLVFFVLALRYLGSARTGAYYSAAPFVGAIVAIVWLQEPLTVRLIVAAILMGIGLYLHLAERHEHDHVHEEMVHEHGHVHDEHHVHEHDPSDPIGEPHTHAHRHAPLRHKHPHYPDLHHRHDH